MGRTFGEEGPGPCEAGPAVPCCHRGPGMGPEDQISWHDRKSGDNQRRTGGSSSLSARYRRIADAERVDREARPKTSRRRPELDDLDASARAVNSVSSARNRSAQRVQQRGRKHATHVFVMYQMSGCRARRMFALRNGQCPYQGSSSACTCVRHSHEAIGVAPGRADERGSRLVAIARHEPRRQGVRRRCTG